MFKVTKLVVCHRCQEPGHIAIGCRKPKSLSFLVDCSNSNQEQLKPHIQKSVVDETVCDIPLDSTATLDSVHPYSVKDELTTGECACRLQVVDNKSVCLPLTRVESEGPFRVLATETVVSQNLPEHCSSQNDADMLLKGLCFGDYTARSLARPLACESAHEILEAESVNERQVDGKSLDDEA